MTKVLITRDWKTHVGRGICNWRRKLSRGGAWNVRLPATYMREKNTSLILHPRVARFLFSKSRCSVPAVSFATGMINTSFTSAITGIQESQQRSQGFGQEGDSLSVSWDTFRRYTVPIYEPTKRKGHIVYKSALLAIGHDNTGTKMLHDIAKDADMNGECRLNDVSVPDHF